MPPPTGTQVYSEVVPFASGNRFNAVGDTVTITFDVYYHLPSGGKEALINLSFTLVDDDDNRSARRCRCAFHRSVQGWYRRDGQAEAVAPMLRAVYQYNFAPNCTCLAELS